MPPVERHNRPVILFVTLAIQPRGNYLASDVFQAVFLEACREADLPSASETPRGWRWQPNCWDTQVRSGEHYHETWLYVRENPVRAGLVDDAGQWAYQGELNVLLW